MKNCEIMEKAVENMKKTADKYNSTFIYLKGNYDDENALCEKEFFKQAEFIVSLGGDGTILKIASKVAENNICIFGINFGRVGFLTDIEKDDTELFYIGICHTFVTKHSICGILTAVKTFNHIF